MGSRERPGRIVAQPRRSDEDDSSCALEGVSFLLLVLMLSLAARARLPQVKVQTRRITEPIPPARTC